MAMVGPYHVDRSSLAFSSITILAFIAKITSTAITTTLAATALATEATFPLAIIASLFEILALITLLVATGFFLRRVSRSLMIAVWIPGALFCLIGSILALITLSSARSLERGNVPSKGLDDQYVHGLAGAGLAAAVIGIIPQVVFWTMTWPRIVQHSVLPVHDQLLPSQQVKQRSISLHLGSIGMKQPGSFFGAQHQPTSQRSLSYSHLTTSGRSSLRNSATESLRPMTSKTRLILQTSFGSRTSRGTQPAVGPDSQRARSIESDFEHWDTSRVKRSFETTSQRKPQVPRLEPIPGSRPVSPAHPLDGPFAGVDNSESMSLRNFEPPVTDTDGETCSIANLPRLYMRQGSTPSIASPASPTADQQHIHPLFRTESPVPPPLTSLRTVITASPYAGQIFSPEFALQSPRLLGSSDGSRPSSPAVLASMRSRPGSVKSCRTIPASPIDSTHEPLPERSCSRLAAKNSRPGTPLSPTG